MVQLLLLLEFHRRPGWIPRDAVRHTAFLADVCIALAILVWA